MFSIKASAESPWQSCGKSLAAAAALAVVSHSKQEPFVPGCWTADPCHQHDVCLIRKTEK